MPPPAPYFAYFDPTQGADGEYKYAAPTAFGDSFEHEFIPRAGYWIKSYADGNLTFTSAGGTYTNATYNWADVMVDNGTTEMNLSQADDAGWLNESLYYWSDSTWKSLCPEAFPYICNSETFSSWQGVFTKTYNNITFIRRN